MVFRTSADFHALFLPFLPLPYGSTTINTSALCRLYSDTEKHSGDFILPCCSRPQGYLGVWLPIGWDKQNWTVDAGVISTVLYLLSYIPLFGGDGKIRTFARLSPPIPLAGEPLQPTWVHLHEWRPLPSVSRILLYSNETRNYRFFIVRYLQTYWRKWKDSNPRAAINDLVVFKTTLFSLLSTLPNN